MASIVATAMAPRQRRKTQTPLPLAIPKKRTISTLNHEAGSNFLSVMVLLSLLCIVICGIIFFATSLPANANSNTLFFDKRRTSSRSLNFQSKEGRERETHAIIHVNLSEIQSSSRQYDVVVVGSGPAGLTAALFASRMGMSALVIGSPSSGSLSGTDRIDNFPSFFGYNSGGGQGWVDATMEQASSFGTQFAPPTVLATGLVKAKVQEHTVFEVHLNTHSSTRVVGKSVIVASGSTPRRLNLLHETSLWGHTLHNCALCDGDAYVRDGLKKSVAVIGGGDAAVEAIFLLHRLGVDSIHWIHRREEYRASSLEVEKVRNLPNVDVWTPYVVEEWIVKEIYGDRTEDNPDPLTLEGIRIVGAKNGVADSEATSSLTIPCDGAFLMIGSTPNSKWLELSGIDIDPVSQLIRLNHIVDDSASDSNESNPPPKFSTSTSIQGVFAAGEVVDEVYRQALTASSEGAKAAIDAQRYLRSMGIDTIASTPSSQSAMDQTNLSRRKTKKSELNQSEQKKSTGPVQCNLTKPDCIKSVVSTHPVVVFSKSYCPHCRRALEALHSFTEPLVIELTDIREGPVKVQNALERMTGRRTVPNVFVGGKSIGGGDETVALYREGRLEGLLRKAGAID